MSYALNKLDLKMEPYLKDIEDGFYIECGANDGVRQSNTLYFNQKYNWKGLLVEPNPGLFLECVKNRPNDIVENYALVDFSYQEKEIKGHFQFTDYVNGLMGQCTVNNPLSAWNLHDPSLAISVNAITLNELLIKHKINKIEFFSLDVEGYEMFVLNGINFEMFRPKFILVENYLEDRKKPIIDFMTSKNYTKIEELSDGDTLYTSNI